MILNRVKYTIWPKNGVKYTIGQTAALLHTFKLIQTGHTDILAWERNPTQLLT